MYLIVLIIDHYIIDHYNELCQMNVKEVRRSSLPVVDWSHLVSCALQSCRWLLSVHHRHAPDLWREEGYLIYRFTTTCSSCTRCVWSTTIHFISIVQWIFNDQDHSHHTHTAYMGYIPMATAVVRWLVSLFDSVDWVSGDPPWPHRWAIATDMQPSAHHRGENTKHISHSVKVQGYSDTSMGLAMNT